MDDPTARDDAPSSGDAAGAAPAEASEDGGAAPAAAPRFKFPTALTVLALILGLVWLASFVIPSGRYQLDPATRRPIPGTYAALPPCAAAAEGQPCVDKSLLAQFRLLWTATPNGLYGIESPVAGRVSADELGFLYGSAQIFLFVLAVGAFITMTMKTGAIETGIGRLALRFRNSPALIIVLLMLVFALGGTTYGMWEETLGFFALLVPLILALKFDRLVAVAIIFLGAGTGVLASTVNPFATGVASDAAGISITEGLGLRLAMWVVLVPVAIGYVLWYANRVRKDPTTSLAGIEGAAPAGADAVDVPPLTSRQAVVLVLFAFAFLTMIYGFIPWDDVWTTLFGSAFPLPTFGAFYFTEASMLFIVMAVVIGAIARFGEEGIVADHRGRRVRLPRRGAGDRGGAGHHRGDEEHLHHRHHPKLDGGRRDRQVELRLRRAGLPRQPADRLPGALLLGPRGAGHADPRPAGRLRGRAPGPGRHRLPVRLGLHQLPDAHLRRGDGRPRPGQARLRPLPPLRPPLHRHHARPRQPLRLHRHPALAARADAMRPRCWQGGP